MLKPYADPTETIQESWTIPACLFDWLRFEPQDLPVFGAVSPDQ